MQIGQNQVNILRLNAQVMVILRHGMFFSSINAITLKTNDIENTPFWIVQKLYQWHFDVSGLIENNLAEVKKL